MYFKPCYLHLSKLHPNLCPLQANQYPPARKQTHRQGVKCLISPAQGPFKVIFSPNP